MRLRNISPLGAIELPLLAELGRSPVLEPGEVFDIDDDLAGQAPSVTVGDDGQEVLDPGRGLLAQVGVFEAASTGAPSTSWKRAELVAHARAAGVPVADSATKAQIVAAVEAAQNGEGLS